jgi:hypothetical protein
MELSQGGGLTHEDAQEIKAMLEALIEHNDPQKFEQFVDARGLEQKYPLGFALFYSDGSKTLHYGRPGASDSSFDPDTITVVSASAKLLCINIPSARLHNSTVELGQTCFGTPPWLEAQTPQAGQFVNVARVGDIVLEVEILASSADAWAWVIGMRQVP